MSSGRTAAGGLGLRARLRRSPALVGVLLGVTVCAGGAASANAATAHLSGSKLVYEAAPGEANVVSVYVDSGLGSPVGDELVVQDSVPIVPGAGCTAIDLDHVRCGHPASLHVDLGDLNDLFAPAGAGNAAADLPMVVLGGEGADVLMGGNAADRLDGGAGDDRFSEGAGDDVVIGGAGDDRFEGSPGADSYAGGDGNDVFSSDLVAAAASHHGVSITLDGVANDGQPGEGDNVGPDVEVLSGTDADDTVIGNEGANRLSGYRGHDVLVGGAGPDVLYASGSGTMSGGPGNDRLVREAADSAYDVSGGEGIDIVDYAPSPNDGSGVTISLDGVANDGLPGAHDNVESDVENVVGSPGSDVLVGDAEDNVLVGGGGADVLVGGAGRDTVDYSGLARVEVSLDGIANDGRIDAYSTLGEGDNVSADIERVIGSSADDVLVGGPGDETLDGGGGDDVLDGGPGADTLIGSAGADLVDYSSRGAPVTVDLGGPAGNDGQAGEGDTVGADVEGVAGGSGDDVLTGNDADNYFDGGPGADVIHGGGGVDLVDYSARTAAVTVDLDGQARDDGAAGEGDTVGADVEDVFAGAGDDRLIGGPGANYLDGGPGRDVLDGGPGPDTFVGGDGQDLADYGSRTAAVTVDLDDQVGDDGETGEGDTIATDVEDVQGGAGPDRLTGNDLSNVLSGGAGNDQLEGRYGMDTLRGEGGDDTVNSRDTVGDAVSCGDGNDLAILDVFDSIPGDCESFDIGQGVQQRPKPFKLPVPIPEPPPRPADRTPPAVSLRPASRLRLTTLLKRGTNVLVGCSEACRLDVSLTLAVPGRVRSNGVGVPRRKLVVGAGHVDFSAAGRARTAVVLTRAGARRLRRLRTASLELSAVAIDAAGNRQNRSVTVLFVR